MSAPGVLSGELLALVIAARTLLDNAYHDLRAANERGVTADDLDAFSAAMRARESCETEIRTRWFSRAARVQVDTLGSAPRLLVYPKRGAPRFIDEAPA